MSAMVDLTPRMRTLVRGIQSLMVTPSADPQLKTLLELAVALRADALANMQNVNTIVAAANTELGGASCFGKIAAIMLDADVTLAKGVITTQTGLLGGLLPLSFEVD